MKTRKSTRICTLFLAVCVLCALAAPAFAATVKDAAIDESKTGSLTLYKYDFTEASVAGVPMDTYVSTGAANGAAEAALAPYAIEGVEYTYLKVAEIVQFSEAGSGAHARLLYRFDKAAAAGLLAALELTEKDAYAPAAGADAAALYFESDVLSAALRAALAAKPSATRSALEAYITSAGGTALPKTDENGKTGADGLPLGLYLLVETAVPEQVTRTTAPFFLQLPMTTADGGDWNYDVVVYPKNETGDPTLEKTVREAKTDGGTHEGSSAITDGYGHTVTASAGDVVEYQIISRLPAITSNATHLTRYTFTDALSKGLTYTRGDVKLHFDSTADCESEGLADWTEEDGKFTVTYTEGEDGGAVMTIAMTAAGLKEINAGYSGCYLRITYTAAVRSDAAVVYGDKGDPNTVELTWQRTSSGYADQLVDDCHVYSYGIDLTKKFSDGKGNFQNVEFLVYNETDGSFLIAKQDKATGIYYVTGHSDTGTVEDPGDGTYDKLLAEAKAAAEAAATHFVPTKEGRIAILGLEKDTYLLTEVKTDAGYNLLAEDITLEIVSTETEDRCPIYTTDKEDVVQTRPAHKLLTASATVDGNPVTMLEDPDDSSPNAIVPLSVTNTRGTDLPPTGERGTVLLTVAGTAVAFAALFGLLLLALPRRRKQD